ncbi:UNVERIFIED_CONTAM: hypothetical protein Slati_2937400 [Sesamum latifolium]|uniref:Reverse transcriptase Ty1/copia-type domain-containing protein n=1 Tax=Sesamum latifolium TaxID=2727402 RepID=A0AAW2VED1_9LAMI
MTKKPFVGQSAIANGLLDLVHTDVCGPLSIPARGGFSYFITFTDDHSRYGYVYLMRYKSEAFGRFKEYRLEVENQTNQLPPSFWGYALETAAKLLNIAPSKSVPRRHMRYGMARLHPTSQARGERISQRPGVDFEETYSPVAMAKSIWILLAIAAWYDYEIRQMDVKMAFLNGFIEEEIFMDQSEGFTTVGEE